MSVEMERTGGTTSHCCCLDCTNLDVDVVGGFETCAACLTDGRQISIGGSRSSSTVFGSEGDQTTRGALLDMLLLGMTNETGAGKERRCEPCSAKSGLQNQLCTDLRRVTAHVEFPACLFV